jgi:hypothetical protein
MSYSFTDMWSERLLARIRQASDSTESTAERVCASGTLAQWVTEHKLRGFADPRAPTRDQLLQDGVPLRVRKVEKESKPCGVWVNFMRKQEAERKRLGIVLNKHQYREWQNTKREEFNALDPERYAVELAEVRSAYSEKLGEQEDAGHIELDSARRFSRSTLTTVVDIVGDERTPYTAAKLADRVRSTLSLGQDWLFTEPNQTRFRSMFFRLP